MTIKRNNWKVLPLFTAAIMAAVYSFELSQAMSEKPSSIGAVSQLTIDERITRITEKIKAQLKEDHQSKKVQFHVNNNLSNPRSHNFQNWPNWSNWPNWYNYFKR